MDRQIFPTTVLGSLCFTALYDNVYEGLLHSIVRHYRQFQKATPLLKKVLNRLPSGLRNLLEKATFAAPATRTEALKAIADYWSRRLDGRNAPSHAVGRLSSVSKSRLIACRRR
uniref:Uncharacterized protein n=1 Tax=Panagrellus redivivus TaxID=6233 RepID=A0A7E4UPA0_PANRE